MGHIDKLPSRMQKGNFIFQSQAIRVAILDWDLKILDLFCKVAKSLRAPASIHLPLKVRRGRVNVRHLELAIGPSCFVITYLIRQFTNGTSTL